MAVPPLSCDTLLALCAQGDQEAFFRLYQHEAPTMLALVTHMLGKTTDAENLVRDTLILIYKNADAWDSNNGTARAWMYSILRYGALNRLRQLGRKQPHLTVARVAGLQNSQASGLMPVSDFNNAVALLSENERHPLLLAFYHASSYEQMESSLQQAPEQIRGHLQQALRTLEQVVLA